MTDLRPIVVDEVAAASFVGMSVSSLQKSRVRGDGPRFAKLGSRVRYRVQDLEQYVADRVVTSTSEAA
jgi:predicted DNA-binding transcriptional regulator AlpA